jgi:hypothetical protein
MVTAELAASLPVLMLILAVAVAAVSIGGARVRAQDAASASARASARGDPASGRRLFAQLAPPGSSLDLTSDSSEVTATVRLDVRPLGGWLGHYTVVERAVAMPEPERPSP